MIQIHYPIQICPIIIFLICQIFFLPTILMVSFVLITGYRDDSLETVKRNRDQYGIPLKVLSYEDLYGWTMDKIVAQVGC